MVACQRPQVWPSPPSAAVVESESNQVGQPPNEDLSVPEPLTAAPSPVRFGVFEVDLHAGELRKNGAKVRLEGQPFQILALLLQRPDHLVTREELRRKLWPADTFVDFEHSINEAVKRLREALGDAADSPRFIETLPRRGYRFIYPINGAAAEVRAPIDWWRRRSIAGALLSALATVLLALVMNVGGLRDRLLGRPPPGKIVRLAVLPLRNLSQDAEQDYFADGVTEMLITELGGVSPLQVTSHQSVLRYAGSTKPLPEIARELGADALLEGTVLRSGNRVRVTVNLIQADPERHLLAQSYDRDVRDIFGVQREVARAIAQEIRFELPESSLRSSGSRRVAPEASEAFLRGVYVLKKSTARHRQQAREYFEKAIEIDPSFARPYAYLAVMYSHGGGLRGTGAAESRALTRQWAEKALQLDPSLAEAHTALAWLALSEGDWNKAEQEFNRAHELNPSYTMAHAYHAQFLGFMGRYPEAFAETEIALRLDPVSPEIVSHAVEPYLEGGRADDAIKQWRAILDLQPDFWAAHWYLGNAYLRNGRYAHGLTEAQEAVRINDGVASKSLLACVYAKAGRRNEAIKILHDLPARSRMRIASVYVALGENDKALELLEKEYEEHQSGLFYVNANPLLQPLRSDARFQDLVRRIGLPAAKAK